MIDSHVPPHQVCAWGSHVVGKGDVRAGAVSDAGANRSVMSLESIITVLFLEPIRSLVERAPSPFFGGSSVD